MITAEIMRNLLWIVVAAMLLLALAYLSGRKLHPLDLCAWGLVAVALPILGPILVILNRPGEKRLPS